MKKLIIVAGLLLGFIGCTTNPIYIIEPKRVPFVLELLPSPTQYLWSVYSDTSLILKILAPYLKDGVIYDTLILNEGEKIWAWRSCRDDGVGGIGDVWASFSDTITVREGGRLILW